MTVLLVLSFSNDIVVIGDDENGHLENSGFGLEFGDQLGGGLHLDAGHALGRFGDFERP